MSPDFIVVGPVLQALRCAERRPDSLVPTESVLGDIEVQAGNWGAARSLPKWFDYGDLSLNSAAAPDIALILHRLACRLSCPLIVTELPGGFFDHCEERAHTPKDLIFFAAQRLSCEMIPQMGKKRGSRIARLPWTREEAKARLKRRYLTGKRAPMDLPSVEGSGARCNRKELRLTRSAIKAVPNDLNRSRKSQMVLADIICGACFKYYNRGGARLLAKPPIFGAASSLLYLRGHLSLGVPADQTEDNLVLCLCALSQLVAPKSTAAMAPCQEALVTSGLENPLLL